MPPFTLRVIVDGELVSNTDEINVDESFVDMASDPYQLIHEQWRASQIAMVFLRKKMAAGVKAVISLNNVVDGLKAQLAQSKEEIRLSKIVINNLKASSKKEMTKKQNLLKKVEACSLKSLNKLHKRTERFTTFRNKKDAEVMKLRQKAQTAVEHSEKLAKAEETHFKKARAQSKEIRKLSKAEETHFKTARAQMKEMVANKANVEATHFKKARAQTKEIVSLKCDVVQQTRNVQKEVSLLEDTYSHKITAIE